MADLTDVIQDAVNDSINNVAEEAPETDVSAEAPVEASADATSDSDAAEGAEPEVTSEVPSPALQEAPAAPAAPEQDEFSKLVGMPKVGVGGRENRIPYSRVQKIVSNKISEIAEAAVGRKLTAEEKPLEVVKAHVAQIPELTAKVTDYETRLQTVSQFEDVMANDPDKFLTMLEKLPAYKGFFDFVRGAMTAQQGGAAPVQEGQQPAEQDLGMPEPDEVLSDGSRVYSMEGLKALMQWNSQMTETRVASKYEERLKQLDDRFGPMQKDWEDYNRRQAVLPTIRKQIEEAKQWPMFEESEEEILEILSKDKNISLEGAYQKAVFPKLVADRNKVRQDVLAELKKAPAATAIPSRAATRPNAPGAGPRSIEDIIRESVQSLK